MSMVLRRNASDPDNIELLEIVKTPKTSISRERTTTTLWGVIFIDGLPDDVRQALQQQGEVDIEVRLT